MQTQLSLSQLTCIWHLLWQQVCSGKVIFKANFKALTHGIQKTDGRTVARVLTLTGEKALALHSSSKSPMSHFVQQTLVGLCKQRAQGRLAPSWNSKERAEPETGRVILCWAVTDITVTPQCKYCTCEYLTRCPLPALIYLSSYQAFLICFSKSLKRNL